MSCTNNSPDINQVFIIEPLSITGGSPTLSACTTLYSNHIESCSGTTHIYMGNGVITFDGNLYTNNDLTATTINASTYFSGGTNLFDIINASNITGGTFDNSSDTLTLNKVSGSNITVTGFTDYYTTGSTLIGSTIYFDRNDQLSAYTTDLSSLDINDTFVTGVTFTDNQLIITRNDDVNLGVFLNTFTGLTVNGLITTTEISATTMSADTIYLSGSNLYNVFQQINQAIGSATTVVQNGVNTYTGGTTLFPSVNVVANPLFTSVSATTFYGNGTNITGMPYVTGGTFNDTSDTLTFTNSTGGSFTVVGLADKFTTGATLSGSIVTFDRNDTMGAYTLDLSGLDIYDNFISGATFTNNNLILTNNTGGTITVLINDFSGLTVNGNFIVTGNTSISNITGGTAIFDSISATTYQNLPIDVFVTGGTYSNGTAIFTNNTGGTFNISGLYTGATDVFVTGGTFNNTTDSLILTNNTGGTFTVTGLTDYYVTGGTFTSSNKNLRYTRNDDVNIDVTLPFRLLLNASATTTTNSFTVIDTVTGITNNTNSFVVSYVTAYKDAIDYGFWKRTLAINNISGVATIIGENSDFDRISSGMTANNVVYSASSGDILIKISGETAKNYTWTSNWEIIK
jgi:hypothetical protein